MKMKIHIIGICGIGMSGIAKILHEMGYNVQGSDTCVNGYIFEKLQSLGIKVINNHSRENVKDVDLVIKSSAIKDSNEELIASQELNTKVFTRTQALIMLLENKKTFMFSGAHGKSTSTAMFYSILESASLYPSVLCGAIINSINSNAKLGRSDSFILEADESDGTFSKIRYYCGALTNIDFEHIDYYGTFDALINHYRMFIQNVKTSGIVAICRDDERLFNIAYSLHDKSNVAYYAIDSMADVMAKNIHFKGFTSVFDVEFSGKFANVNPMRGIEVNLPGKHNIYNALSAITLAIKLHISEENIKSALEKFSGLQRRFTILGELAGATIIDDYGHHPTEIINTINTAKNIGRVISIIQPHRFTRVKSLFDQYVNLLDKSHHTFLLNVYPAGEQEIENYNSSDIVKSAHSRGFKNVALIEDEQVINEKILEKITSGDVVIFFGAGNVSNLANNFFANTKIV